MKLRTVLAWSALCLLPCVAGDASAWGDAPAPKERFRLYLLIGQSNMAGRGKVEPADRLPHPRVFAFDKNGAWALAVDPLHFDKPKIAGVCLGSSFGRAMADADSSVTVGLIPCAVGGTPLSRWVKGGDLHEAALKRARKAMADGTLAGILWHQGESDSKELSTAESYRERLSGMIADLRAELDSPQLPVVVGKLGEFLEPERLPHASIVNDALEQVGQSVPHAACVESSGLTCKSDQVHFDAKSLREFGKRYAAAMQALSSEPR